METFANGQHTIYHGDALSVLASERISDASIDLIFADPPLSASIEIDEEYLKIGLRRLELAAEYKGEHLHRPLKSYENGCSNESKNLTLFEQ